MSPAIPQNQPGRATVPSQAGLLWHLKTTRTEVLRPIHLRHHGLWHRALASLVPGERSVTPPPAQGLAPVPTFTPTPLITPPSSCLSDHGHPCLHPPWEKSTLSPRPHQHQYVALGPYDGFSPYSLTFRHPTITLTTESSDSMKVQNSQMKKDR